MAEDLAETGVEIVAEAEAVVEIVLQDEAVARIGDGAPEAKTGNNV